MMDSINISIAHIIQAYVISNEFFSQAFPELHSKLKFCRNVYISTSLLYAQLLLIVGIK